MSEVLRDDLEKSVADTLSSLCELYARDRQVVDDRFCKEQYKSYYPIIDGPVGMFPISGITFIRVVSEDGDAGDKTRSTIAFHLPGLKDSYDYSTFGSGTLGSSWPIFIRPSTNTANHDKFVASAQVAMEYIHDLQANGHLPTQGQMA